MISLDCQPSLQFNTFSTYMGEDAGDNSIRFKCFVTISIQFFFLPFSSHFSVRLTFPSPLSHFPIIFLFRSPCACVLNKKNWLCCVVQNVGENTYSLVWHRTAFGHFFLLLSSYERIVPQNVTNNKRRHFSCSPIKWNIQNIHSTHQAAIRYCTPKLWYTSNAGVYYIWLYIYKCTCVCL